MATKTNRDITADFRGAIIEAKESIEGKRKLNTLDKLTEELKEDPKIYGGDAAWYLFFI